MKNREYWIERANLDDKEMLKTSEEVARLLKKELVKVKEDVKKELLTLYANSKTSSYKKSELNNVLKAIDKLLNTLYQNEENIINEKLIERYMKTYEKKASELELKASFTTLTKNVAEKAVLQNWSGATFSERIWENRRKLSFVLKSTIKKGLLRGDSVQDMSRILSKKLDVELKNAKRIIRTETCYVQTKANLQAYKNFDCKKFEFSAHLDRRTSDICRSLDGKVFNIEDAQAGVNIPPLHPNCRSCILPIVD